MKKIEAVLGSGKVFIVDEIACMQHAEVLKNYKRPVENFEWSGRSKSVQLAFKVAFISICHQFNWDFMQKALADNLLRDESSFINLIEKISAPTLSEWLKNYPKPKRIRAKERAAILRDVGKVLRLNFDSDLDLFYKKCSDATLKDGSFHHVLDQFNGYRSDPLRKKTNVLTHDLFKEDIIAFKDPEYIEPAIDYHIMRLYLRSGRVVASDSSLFDYLKGKPNPRGTLVRKLREAVSEAERLVAYYSGLNVADVNYIEWQIGRSICLNDVPICQLSKKVMNVPDDILFLNSVNCPYSETCWAVNLDPSLIELEEPIYISTNY